jgi:hypothetical protein
MEESIFHRKRTPAFIDKKRTILNYDKLDNSNEQKQDFFRRISKQGVSDNEIEMLKRMGHKDKEWSKRKSLDFHESTEIFPIPHKNQSNNKEFTKPIFHKNAHIVKDFDDVIFIDSKYSLVNMTNFLNKFKNEDMKNIRTSDLFTFNPDEYDKVYKKIDEMKKASKSVNDYKLTEFYRSKKRHVEDNRDKMKAIKDNLDKIDDFIIFDDNMKFFFDKNAFK